MSASAHPEVKVWPVCDAPDCETPYILRRCMTFTATDLNYEWLWQRDCKHKKASAIVYDKNGRVEP